jgi:arylsulfatase A-like enzyme
MPLIVRWPGRIKAGAMWEAPVALWDFLPTALELAGFARNILETDGVSFVPALVGKGEQKEHEYLYWEFASKGGQRALRRGNWKAVQVGLKTNPEAPLELYDLAHDPGELHDVAGAHGDIAAQMRQLMREARTQSTQSDWNF